MKAAIYEAFAQPLRIREVPDPTPDPEGVVIRVGANGICRSDWHGWMGHDPSIALPHVPGHELSGVVEEVGPSVARWKPGDRVTVPFVGGCGRCRQCESGNQQVCERQFQPGFTHWGAFAQRVAIGYADENLVRLPDAIEFVTAAALGCRFATSFRAIVAQGRVESGQWVAVFGCGGVGLSAIMIAHAHDARVVGVDITEEKLTLARALGAEATVNATSIPDVVEAVRDATGEGADLSIDALGSADTCHQSVACLRTRGRHVQVGLLSGEPESPRVPMDLVVANELELVGSHGMQAHAYGPMLQMIERGKLDPVRLITRTVSLDESPSVLHRMDRYDGTGVTVIDRF